MPFAEIAMCWPNCGYSDAPIILILLLMAWQESWVVWNYRLGPACLPCKKSPVSEIGTFLAEIEWSSGNGEGTGRGDHRHSYLCSPLRNANGLSEERGLAWEAGAPVPIA